ncbi:oligosaccharide flippase family protein [Weissella paramesenteroides]|uniref:oligosaccharide flippase family protein n=1 Tax=Weissella paramesenteroides TaxID=1249 RepID=UPI003F205E17
MKSVKLNFVYNTAYQLLVILTPLVTAPYIARVFGAMVYGNVSYSNSVLNVFNLFAAYGILTFGQKQIARYQDDWLKLKNSFWNIIYIKVFLVVIIYVVFMIYYFLLADPMFKPYYIVSSVVLFATLTDISWFFMGLEQFNYTFWRNLFVRLFFVIMVFLIIHEKEDAINYILLMYFGNLIGNLTLWIKAIKIVGRPIPLSLKQSEKYFQEATWLFLPTIAITVYLTIDQIILGYFSNKKEVGYFVQADSIVRILTTFVTSLGTVLMPRITNLFQKKQLTAINNILKVSFDFMIYISIPITLIIIFVGQRFVVFFYGMSFYNSGVVLMIEILTIPIVALSNVIGIQYLVPFNKTRQFSLSTLFGAIVNLIILPIFVLKTQAVGTAIALVITELVVTGVQIFFVREDVDIIKLLKQDKSLIYGILAMTVVLIILTLTFNISNDIVFLVTVSIISCLTYLLTTLLFKNHISILLFNTIKGVFH